MNEFHEDEVTQMDDARRKVIDASLKRAQELSGQLSILRFELERFKKSAGLVRIMFREAGASNDGALDLRNSVEDLRGKICQVLSREIESRELELSSLFTGNPMDE